MKQKYKKPFKVNNSNLNEREAKALKVLQKVFTNGGTVTYNFESQRIKFTEENPEGEYYVVKTSQSSDINPAVLYKMEGGKLLKRNPSEILQVFEDTCWDLGANSYEIS